MKHGDKAKAQSAKASSKAPDPKASSKSAGKESSSKAAKAGAESKKQQQAGAAKAPAQKSGGSKAVPKVAGPGNGKNRGRDDEGGFSNPLVGAAFKRAVKKYPNAFRRLTD